MFCSIQEFLFTLECLLGFRSWYGLDKCTQYVSIFITYFFRKAPSIVNSLRVRNISMCFIQY